MSFSSFPICIPFISFSSLITVDMTSKTMLDSSDGNGHPYLVPDFVEMLSISTIEDTVSVGLLYTAFYYVEVCPFYAYFLESFFFFYHKWVLNFVKVILCMG